MNPFDHFAECSLVVRPPRYDRFVLNSRVYEVRRAEGDKEEIEEREEKGLLVWQGIFLAVEADDYLKNLLNSETS